MGFYATLFLAKCSQMLDDFPDVYAIVFRRPIVDIADNSLSGSVRTV